MSWTDERVERLKKLWADGVSCGVIAVRLGNGVTRNAVIGKVARLKLPPRTTRMRAPIGRPPRARKASLYPGSGQAHVTPRSALTNLPKVGTPRLVAEPVPLVSTDVARVALADLEPHHCRFIPGDPRTTPPGAPVYCGERKVEGLSYCAEHAARCTAPPPSRGTMHLPRTTNGHAKVDREKMKDVAEFFETA